VFPNSPVVTRSQSADSKWSWDDPADPSEDEAPMWNPRTGFMKTREQAAAAAAEVAAAEAAAAAASRPGSAAAAAPAAPAASTSGRPEDGTSAAALLPSRSQILGSCVGTGAGLALLAVLIRAYADQNAAGMLGTDADALQQLLRLPAGLDTPVNGGIMAAAAAVVTAARLALMRAWPAFAEATNRSNAQVCGRG